MRTLITIMIIFTLLGCTKSHIIQQSFTPSQISHVKNLKKFEKAAEINNTVFYLEKGDIVPLKVTLESQWFTLKQSQVELIAQQKLYFRVLLPKNMTQEKLEQLQALDSVTTAQLSESEKKKLFDGIMLHASRDAENWAPINHPNALKEVFDIAGGTISFGAAFSAAEGLWTNLMLKVVQKY